MQKLTFLLVLSTLFLSSCAISKKLNYHNQVLTEVANSNAAPQEKLDALLQSYVQLMEEGLGYINPKQGFKLVEQYHEQNEQPINKILGEVQQWQGQMSEVELLTFGLSTLQKPYAKKAIDLFPKFERKYKQIQFVMNLSEKVKSGVTNAIGKKLGK